MVRTLLANVNVLDCTGADPYRGEVLIDGNRIVGVAAGSDVLPRDAHVVDGGGGFLMPGLIESHTSREERERYKAHGSTHGAFANGGDHDHDEIWW